jgi:hypothetical protein
MPDENSTKPKAPYLPYSTFKKFIAGFKSGVPSRIDKTLMNGHSGSMQSWLLSALKFFNLTDAVGAPTENLERLAQGDEDSRKKLWKEIFSTAYSPIVNGLDLKRATLGQLYESFGEEFSVETKKKCQSFFAAGAEDAGIELAPQLKPNTRGTGPRKPRKPKPAETPKADGDGHHEDEKLGGKTSVATLLLDREGARVVKLHAPPTVTKAELDRIQKWLSFQLIVEDVG